MQAAVLGMLELSEKDLSKLPLYGANCQPNSFKRKKFNSKRALYINGFNKENKKSVMYFDIIIFDDDTYKQPQRGNKNAKVKYVKLKKTFPKSRTKEAVMGKKIPMADYLHTVRNVTQILIMNERSFPLLSEELIKRRAALRQVFGDKVPHRMKIAIIKSDESRCKLEEWRTEPEGNDIEIIDHLPRSDYEFLFENPVELTRDFMRKGSKGDKVGNEIYQVHEEEIPDREDIPENIALMGISVRGLKPMTQEEDAKNDVDVHDIKGQPRQVEDVSPSKRREGASAASEPALDMTSQKTYLDEEDIGIIISDELGLKEDDDAENVVDLKELNIGIIISDELEIKEDDDAENVVDLKERMSNRGNAEDRNETTESVSEDILQKVNLHEHKVSNRENAEDRNETTESVSEDILQKVNLHEHKVMFETSAREGAFQEFNSRDLYLRKQPGATPFHQALLSENFILILHALVNYVRLHAMNAFIVPGSHSVGHPIWTSEVYVIIRIFENGKEIICRLFKNKLGKKGKKSKKGNHAEDVCLEALEDLMKDKNTDNWRIMMYVSYSPCDLCRPKIITFIGKNEISLDLKFPTLFQMNRASCKENICKCQPFSKHDKNRQEFIDMKDNPYIDSIGIVAAAERRELSEVLHLNLSEDILQKLNQLKHNDDIEMASDAEDLGILKSGRGWTETDNQGVGVDLVGGVNGRPVTEDGVNNNLTGQDGVYSGVMDNNIDQNSSLSVNWDSDDDSEDGVFANLNIRSIAEKMNVVQRSKDWRPKTYTPAENSTTRIREAHRADNDLQREEDKLDEATGGAEVGR